MVKTVVALGFSMAAVLIMAGCPGEEDSAPTSCNANNGCCGKDGYKCKYMEGDCDSDTDCESGLKCGQDNCHGGNFESWHDCCYNPSRDHKCVYAYQHNNLGGEKYTICLGRGGPIDWQKRISSVYVEEGMKVMFCDEYKTIRGQHQPGDGFCRTFFPGTYNNVGEALNDRIQFYWADSFDKNDFALALASDPQYNVCHHNICKTRWGTDGKAANKRHAQSMKAMRDSFGFRRFAGVVMNGDLSNVATNDEINFYRNTYNGENIYMALGNHDYQNLMDRWCNGYFMRPGSHYRAQSKYLCTVWTVDWLIYEMPPYANADVKLSGSWNEHVTGSLAYSWDIGSWHFAHLNNHNDYTTSYSAYDSWWWRYRNHRITESSTWLRSDLSSNKDKKTVIFSHKPVFNSAFRNIIDNNPQVKAVFCGHQHERIMWGQSTKDDGSMGEDRRHYVGRRRRVKVYFTGSGETNMYLQARFKNNDLFVRAVNSYNGRVEYIGDEKKI